MKFSPELEVALKVVANRLNMSREETVGYLLEIQISILILDPADRIKINDMIFKHKNNGN